ncbi:MAG TPA: hypothetical protein VK603_26345 [Candidatus Saccharimonadales bacterium]|nr:hypothetical protein [Candidatus Saccharimonadales bacterium]
MAESHSEIAKDIVVALLSRIEALPHGNLTKDPEPLGKALATIYRIVLEEVNK